ncbi:MAG: isoprenylcysteine carboxylmethyltransferase family protein [Bacteroidota bacterium]|nr:isoprenylcysteine carboxylmethyltransferase family protein [Bacteroidota bacterium]
MKIAFIALSIIPEFNLGILNAWIGTFPIMLLPLIFRLFNRSAFIDRAAAREGYNKSEKRMVDYTMAVYYLILLYSIVLPLKFDTNSFYVGLAVYVIAISCLLITYFNFKSTPRNQLVTHGIFRLSRNPFYSTTIIAFLGVGMASLSWLLILLTIIMAILQHQVVLAEERICEAQYGKEYLEYKARVPRYLLFF